MELFARALELAAIRKGGLPEASERKETTERDFEFKKKVPR